MASISSKETKPEIAIRKYLFRQGFRFRKNVKKLPGSPDIVLPKYKTAIFVNGCFWHGHNCKQGKASASNKEFWAKKIMSNIERDERVERLLREQDWKVVILWTCQLKSKKSFDCVMDELTKKLITM